MPSMPKRTAGYSRGQQAPSKNDRTFNSTPDHRYNSTAWRRLAKGYLAQHPMCAHDGCDKLATVCDHVHAVVDGGEFWTGPFQGLCAAHHNAKSSREKWARIRGQQDGQS